MRSLSMRFSPGFSFRLFQDLLKVATSRCQGIFITRSTEYRYHNVTVIQDCFCHLDKCKLLRAKEELPPESEDPSRAAHERKMFLTNAVFRCLFTRGRNGGKRLRSRICNLLHEQTQTTFSVLANGNQAVQENGMRSVNQNP